MAVGQIYQRDSSGVWHSAGRGDLGAVALVPPAAEFPTLTFRDEFDTPSLDLSKWTVRNFQLPYEMSESISANVIVNGTDSLLRLATIKQTSPAGRPWTSGYISSAGKFAQQYGYFEARIKVNTTASTSAGLWPAFWGRPDNTSFTGELDWMECWGEPHNGSHQPDTDYPVGGGYTSLLADTNHTDNRKITIKLVPAAGRLSDGFNTYGFKWNPTGMTMYLNGAIQGSRTYTAAGDIPWYTNYNTPFHIRLQVQVGQLNGTYPDLTPGYWGVPDANTLTYSEMQVDWVRVWGP